jgi:hypothetical protein
MDIENCIGYARFCAFENSSLERIVYEMYEPAVIAFKENVRATKD